MIEGLFEQFAALDDPRYVGKIEYRLVDVLVIAVCAVVAERGLVLRSAPGATRAASPRPCRPCWCASRSAAISYGKGPGFRLVLA